MHCVTVKTTIFAWEQLSIQFKNITIMKNLNTFLRYKKDFPFSERLNKWINIWFEQREELFEFSLDDDFDKNDIEGTFESHKKRFRDLGKIKIWVGCSDNTIFGNAEVNCKFRAWHDYVHINNNLGYSQTEESIVSDIQKNQLPKEWVFEKELIHAEIVGQAHYNFINNSFVNNQRLFTIEYLQDTIKALNNKNFKG